MKGECRSWVRGFERSEAIFRGVMVVITKSHVFLLTRSEAGEGDVDVC